MPYLVLQQEDSQDKIFKITKAVITLGRKHTNDVFLMDESVSRDHLIQDHPQRIDIRTLICFLPIHLLR